MLKPELLRRELANGLMELLGRRAFRHREDDVVDKFRPPAARDRTIRMRSRLFEIQGPVGQQPLGHVVSAQPLPVISLELALSLAADVVDMARDAVNRAGAA